MKRLMLAALAAFFTLAAADGMAAGNVNTGIEDADMMSAEWAPQFGDAVIDAGYPVDLPGPGVRWQATPTVGSGWTNIGIGDNFSIGNIYGFPVIPVGGGNFADWTGYTHYKLAVTNNSASDWVEAKAYYTTGAVGYWHQDVAWLAPGATHLLSIDLSVPGFDYGGGVPEPGPPNLATVSHFGIELGTNYGTGEQAGQHFDVTVATVGDARLEALPALSGPINCSGASNLDFVFSPGPSSLHLRGYEVTLGVSPALTFGAADIHDSGAFDALGPHLFRVVDNGDGTITVADALLGDTDGVWWVESFFDVFFHGAATGDGAVSLLDVKLRDLDNVDIAVTTAGAMVLVDCTAPATPTLATEPEYTAGTSNTVTWSDESASGAVLYAVDCAKDALFADIVYSSGWVAGPSHEFTPLDDAQIYYYRVKAKDALDNETGWSTAVFSTQDATPPASRVSALPPYHNVLSFPIAYTASDATSGVAQVELWVSVDGGPYSSAGTYTSSPIAFTAGGDGTYGFFTTATDWVGWVESWPDTIPDAGTIVDMLPPGPVDGFWVEVQNGEILVNWQPPGGGTAGVAIYRGLWHDGSGGTAYPEYDDLENDKIPTRPATRAEAEASLEWFHVGDFPAASGSQLDLIPAPRGVYYYELFPFDAAGNYGPPTANTDRATNYWLGDIADGDGVCDAYDGYVVFSDVHCLGGAYGTADGDEYYDPEIDVGPTDDSSAKGIPLTDSVIGFEDLMIISMNYELVAPRPMPGPGAAALAELAWSKVGPSAWALVLLEPCRSLKGLRLQGTIPTGTPVTLSAGSLLGQQVEHCFLRNVDRNGLDVSLALLGEGATIQGTGELLRVELPAGHEPEELGVQARDADNAGMPVSFAATETPALPTAYRLAQNFPNPFNPKTTLRFDLPEEQAVKLAVFAADGRRIITLVDAVLPAGFHSAVWNGQDAGGERVASGVYFYRIEAGPLKQTGRMLLLK